MLKQTLCADFKRKIQELNDEKTQILKACAQFGLFLKENSIIPYNDAMMGYLNLMIKLEKEKALQTSVSVRRDFSMVEVLLSFCQGKSLIELARHSYRGNGSLVLCVLDHTSDL